MTAKDKLHGAAVEVPTEIKEHFDRSPIVPEATNEQENDSSAECGDCEFRPLTEEEKKEFIEALDDKGRQILAEVAVPKS